MDYDLVLRLTTTFRELEHALQEFKARLGECRLLAARIFTLPPVTKGNENAEISQIAVQQHVGKKALALALDHFSHLFIQQQSENQSSKAASRLPGAICLATTTSQRDEINRVCQQVNQLKAALEQIITVDSGLASAARFDWVHRALPGLITLNAYRRLTLLEHPTSVRFGWANKHIIKNLTRDQVLAILEKGIKSPRAAPPLNREQRLTLLTKEYNDIANLPESARLKIKRPVKVQPIARVWYPRQQKQVQLACPAPLVVLCAGADRASVPELGELLNYDADAITHRHRPQAEPMTLLIPRLHLWLAQTAE